MSLKIGVIHTPPITTLCSLSPKCAARGYGVEAARMACEFLDLNCTFHWYESNEYGTAEDNGTGTGLIGAVQRGEFDTGLPVFTPTYQRSKAVSFSNLYFYPDMVLFTRSPTQAPDTLNWSLLYAFQWPIWCLFLLALLSSSLLITSIAVKLLHLGTHRRMMVHSSVLAFLQNCHLLLSKDFRPCMLHCSSVRILVGLWALVALALESAYTGILFSQKVTQRTSAPFVDLPTFVTCLEQGQCQLIMPSVAMSYYQLLTESGNELSARVTKALQWNPVILKPQQEIPKAILDEQSKYLVWLWVKEGVHYDTRGNENCSFYIVDTPFKDLGAFPMRRGSPLVERLSKLALAFQEKGLELALRQKYERPVSCDLGATRSWAEEGHGLYSVRTIFYFYAIGLCVAIGVFAAERALTRVFALLTAFANRAIYRMWDEGGHGSL